MRYNCTVIKYEVNDMSESKVRVSVYLTEKEKEALQALAQQDLRSMASEARAIIVEKLKLEKK